MVYTSKGPLVVAEQSADEGAVRRALKHLDPDLLLTTEVDFEYQQVVYRVFKSLGSEREAAWICDWRGDEGEPLPLTSRLVDQVRDLRLGSRAPVADPVAYNERLREKASEQFEEMMAEQATDGARRMRRAPCFPPSQALRMARDKQRANGHNL